MNKDSIQKNYYDQLTVGNYIDVRYSQNEWRLAKIINRDKRYATISYDGYNSKEEQVFLSSLKVAPLRTHTEGYTGSTYRAHRSQPLPISQYKNHLEIINHKFLKDKVPSAFETTEHLRGQFFVYVHSLLCQEELKQQQGAEALIFLYGFIEFIVKVSKKVISIASEYFENLVQGNKMLYLINDKISLVNALIELIILLNYILRVENNKLINLFKSNKLISQQGLIKYFLELKEQQTFLKLFNLNDNNGKWLPFHLRKYVYKLLKKYYPKLELTTYKIRDYLEIFQIYPFMIKQSQNNKIEEEYIIFIMSCLKEQSPFQAKLKSIQQIKKILDEELKLSSIDQKKLFGYITDWQIIEHMLSQYHFNPEIFKRFVPILPNYCKYKQFNQKNITALFRLSQKRHQSEMSMIYDIICGLAQFIQTDSLDNIYTQICKMDINNERILKLIKGFTINAIINYSKQKSFFSSFFKKNKSSSKYGYFGLELFYKQIQDTGRINKKFMVIVLDMFKQIFNNQYFQGTRFQYLTMCLGSIEKKKSYGQSLKLMDNIVSTYPNSAFLAEYKKQIIQKLDYKGNLLQIIINCIRDKENINCSKISFSECLKYFYQFLDNYGDYLKTPIKIQQIQFLWMQDEVKMLCDFLKKPNPQFSSNYKKKYIKKLDQSLQEEILKKLVTRPSFYDRKLIFEQFEALEELFLSYNLIKKKIEISQRGCVRYLTNQLEGSSFFFEFMEKMSQNNIIEKLIKRTIQIFLRPKEQRNIELKIETWKFCFLKMVQKLKSNPQVCLNSIRLFFQQIQGKMFKQNMNNQGNAEVIVSCEGVQKIIVIAKNCTLFKLRKMIMKAFNMENDFVMFNIHMKRDISFIEEEEFSINAMPLQSKGPSLTIVNRKKERHPHFIAIKNFKILIEKQQKFYTILFNVLNKQEVRQTFWKIVDILPVNGNLVRKIQNCGQFTSQQWKKILKKENKQALQYNLNIIYDLMEKDKKWIAIFHTTNGFQIIIQCLDQKISQKNLNQRIINRLLLITIKIIQNIDIINMDLINKQNLTLISKLEILFEEKNNNLAISIELLNNIFHLLDQNEKLLKKYKDVISINCILKIMEHGILRSKNKESICFTEKYFEHYLINHFLKIDQKQVILTCLIDMLNIQKLQKQYSCELLFSFLIDYMNTFIQQQDLVFQNKSYIPIIQTFIQNTINGPYMDQSKTKYSYIIYGSLKLLLYILSTRFCTLNLSIIFQKLIQQFLFKKTIKRIKSQNNLKLLYEVLKKLLFMKQDLLDILINIISPQLRKNQWRKNMLSSWAIEPQKQQKNLFCGLQNLGATCYINCLFQQLFMTPKFRDSFLQIDSRKYKPIYEENQIYQLQNIFASLKYSNKKSMSTKKFCDSFINYEGLPINPTIQSDSDQFFNTLMQKMEYFLKSQTRHDIIENTFQGKLSNQLNCEGCPHNSQKEQNFLSIGVNIKNKKTLQQALQGFVEGEMLDGDNAYFCQICQKKVKTMKRLCIKELPNILIIVLKRFEFNYDEMRKIKMNNYLKFPQILDMKKYTSNYLLGQHSSQQKNYQYTLHGIVIHSGTSEGGHYYSFIKSEDKWYIFNDENIQQINVKRIQQDGFGGEDKDNDGQLKFQKYKNAYILLYEKNQNKIDPINLDQQKNDETIVKEPIDNTFEEQLKYQILIQNDNADFLSVILEGNFARLFQNISILQNNEAAKVTLLYFHTVVLRDKNRDQYIPNFYRIIMDLLRRQGLSLWYLQQINYRFLKEFCIQAPKIVRFICVSIVIQAIKNVDKIPQSFINHAIYSLKKQGMTPFAKIFKYIQISEKQYLVKNEYQNRVMSILLEQSNNNYSPIIIELFEGYFGTDSSEKQKDREVCSSSLCESLKHFDLHFTDTLKIFLKYHSRQGTKSLAFNLAAKTTECMILQVLGVLQANILKQNEFKKEDLEKYFYYVRSICLINDETSWRIDKSAESIKKIVFQARTYYDPMETILKEIIKISKKQKLFLLKWKAIIQDKQPVDLVKTLKYWLKQIQKPLLLSKSDEYKRKTINLNYEDKYNYEQANKLLQENRVNWMIQKQCSQLEDLQSDIDNQNWDKQFYVCEKKFKIKEHLGLVKKVQIDHQERWGIIEKNSFDIYYTL